MLYYLFGYLDRMFDLPGQGYFNTSPSALLSQ